MMRRILQNRIWYFAIAALAVFIATGFAQGANTSIQLTQNEDADNEDRVAPENTDTDGLETEEVETSKPANSNVEEVFPIPEVITDLSEVPFPVRKMRELILKAARSGDVEKLRPYLGYGDDVTMLSLGGFDEDPIEFLKSLSGDEEGHEILAIMTEILEAPFVKIEEQAGNAVYVWPYFYSYPFDELTPEQRVHLFRIITYGDYEEMLSFGSYIFYRLGITPQGRWRFFVAGD